jgi:hypothetical protein
VQQIDWTYSKQKGGVSADDAVLDMLQSPNMSMLDENVLEGLVVDEELEDIEREREKERERDAVAMGYINLSRRRKAL